ncbi:hypothetical protein [Paraburkholderia sp. CI3]|uniref:hypothetical protein n=1 Tax=Paraburkholderia sp. CI3 TaxID=2991060 RepID=UPI003D1F18D0
MLALALLCRSTMVLCADELSFGRNALAGRRQAFRQRCRPLPRTASAGSGSPQSSLLANHDRTALWRKGPARHTATPVTVVTYVFGEIRHLWATAGDPGLQPDRDRDAMDPSLHFLTALTLHPATEARAQARFLTLRDMPALLDLEREKWYDDQAASQADLRARIDAHPELAVGAFCTRTGRMLASLFLKPVPDDFCQRVLTWKDCTLLPSPRNSSSLFGISLSSRDPLGVDALLKFFWPHALKGGWRHIYLGSPVPGLRDWRRHHPQGRVEDYVSRRRARLPADPQLRYYHSRGFKEIVCVKPGYFPHERSLDHGVVLRGAIPLSALSPVWQALSLTSVRRITQPLTQLL